MVAKSWNEHRGTITELYINQGRTLENVRDVMKTGYNFEASIRSYRQHFKIWEIGKYNCKKRQRRRLQSQGFTPPALPRSPALGNSSDTESSTAWSCASQRSLEQTPLPGIQQFPQYAPPLYFGTPPLPPPPLLFPPEPRIKIENGGEALDRRDVSMCHSAAPCPPERAAMGHTHITRRPFQLIENTPSIGACITPYTCEKPARKTAHWAPSPSVPVSNDAFREYCGLSYKCMSEFPRHSEMASGLSSPSLSMVGSHSSRGALYPPFSRSLGG